MYGYTQGHAAYLLTRNSLESLQLIDKGTDKSPCIQYLVYALRIYKIKISYMSTCNVIL